MERERGVERDNLCKGTRTGKQKQASEEKKKVLWEPSESTHEESERDAVLLGGDGLGEVTGEAGRRKRNGAKGQRANKGRFELKVKRKGREREGKRRGGLTRRQLRS